MRVLEGFCRLVVGLDVKDRVCLESIPFVPDNIIIYVNDHLIERVEENDNLEYFGYGYHQEYVLPWKSKFCRGV